MNKELRMRFLRLWDKAVGLSNYEKEEWQELEKLINQEIEGKNYFNFRNELNNLVNEARAHGDSLEYANKRDNFLAQIDKLRKGN